MKTTLTVIRISLLFLMSLICIGLVWTAMPIQSVQGQDDNVPLRVATHPIEPFVMQVETDSGVELDGFSVDLWDALANKLGVETEWVIVDSVHEQLEAVENGDADLAIAAITINREREERVDFAFPYFNSGLQIMASHTSSSSLEGLLSVLSVFLSPVILQMIGLLIIAILIAAHAAWLVERKKNPEFHTGYLQGIWDAFWWASVTVTTVGYGDKTTKGTKGRIVTLIWIFVGLFLTTQFTASVTATLAVQHMDDRGISSLADLERLRVATVENTTSEEFLRSRRLRPITVPLIGEAIDMLEAGETDAVVFDAPVLQYYATNEGAGSVRTVGAPFRREWYGIALPSGSPLRDTVDQILLDMLESGEYDTIYASWFGAPPP